MVEGNKSLPYGIIKLVRACFRRLGLYEFFNQWKDKGVPLGFVIEFICINLLSGVRSMNKGEEKSCSELVRNELCHGYHISRKTMERGLQILDLYFEETIFYLWTKLNEIYPDLNHDSYVDGSFIPRHGKGRGKNTAAGEGGGTVQLQDQFMVAQLCSSGLPIMVETYRGNLNDPPQYADFVPQLMHLLRDGSMIIMDNGGAARSMLSEIKEDNKEYLTRVRLNSSDEKRIAEEIGDAEYVGLGTMCIRHCFQSNEKTTYLFFSVDRYIMGALTAERKKATVKKQAEQARKYVEKKDTKGLVKVNNNPFLEIKSVKLEAQMTLNPWIKEDIEKTMNESVDDITCGWFKLECSKRLSALEALLMYRHRTSIEHLISSIKSIVHLKPLRVWNESTMRGSVLAAMISQLAISMVRFDLEPDIVTKKVDGKVVKVEHKPSAETICENLIH